MLNLLLVMNPPFGEEAIKVFNEGLKVMLYGMSTVIGVLFLFYIIVKLLIKMFPGRK